MYSLRPATEEDVLPMMAIGHEGLRPHVERIREWSESEEEEGFKRHFEVSKVQIVTFEGNDIGYVKVMEEPDCTLIDGIYLSKAARTKGIGSAILQNILASSSRPVRLRVHKGNPAHRLYVRLGFQCVGETQSQFEMEFRRGA